MQYEPILVQFSASSKNEASQIVESLISEKLIACAHISGPVTSTYFWEGKIEESNEFTVQAKTFSLFWEAIEKRIQELHSYSVPEILAFPIREISHYYYVWMIKEIIETQNKSL